MVIVLQRCNELAGCYFSLTTRLLMAVSLILLLLLLLFFLLLLLLLLIHYMRCDETPIFASYVAFAVAANASGVLKTFCYYIHFMVVYSSASLILHLTYGSFFLVYMVILPCNVEEQTHTAI